MSITLTTSATILTIYHGAPGTNGVATLTTTGSGAATLVGGTLNIPTPTPANIGAEFVTEYKTAAFTAVVGHNYNANDSGSGFTVTNPATATAGDWFDVFVQDGTVTVNAVARAAGSLVKMRYIGAAWVDTLTVANANTLAGYTPETLPVSTATQTELNLKVNSSSISNVAIPKTASFAAAAGKHYSVNTDNAVVVTEVFASGALDGIRFTGTSWNQVLTILFYYSEGNPVGYDNSDPTTLVLYGDSALTLQDIIDMVNGSGIVTAALDTGASGATVIGDHDGSAVAGDSVALEGGVQPSITYAPVVASLPVPTGSGAVIEFSDAHSSWGINNLRLDADGSPINGIAAVKLVKTPALLITLVDVGGSDGWRVYSVASVPDNLVLPALSGETTEYSTLTSTHGTWTNVPTDYAYQWQISDTGTGGWTNLGGATSSTYTALHEQIGKHLRCGVVATNASGDSERVYSATVAITAPTLRTGLVAHWKLDETSGTRYDSHTGHYDLTDNNAVGYAAGKIGNAADFNGTNFLSVPSVSIGIKTFSSWIKTESRGTYNEITYINGTQIQFISDGSLRINGAVNFVGGPILNDGQWHFVTIVFNDSETKFFIDGIGIGSTSAVTISEPSDIVEIGATNGVFDMWEGQIDSVSIWSRALSDGEVTALYNGGAGLDYESFGG